MPKDLHMLSAMRSHHDEDLGLKTLLITKAAKISNILSGRTGEIYSYVALREQDLWGWNSVTL
jgi:hypothetical protein